jgi:hypothetical protein
VSGGGRDSEGKGRGRRGRNGEERRRKKTRKNWGKERKLEQERAKQIDIWTEWKREIGNDKLKKMQKVKIN